MFASRSLVLGRNLKDIISIASSGIASRRPITELVKIVTADPDFFSAESTEMAEFVVICARLQKLGNRNANIKELQERASEAIEHLDANKLESASFSKFLWACATIDVKPLLAEDFADTLIEKGLSNRDLVTIISALSKFIVHADDPLRQGFNKLTDRISYSTSAELSNEDLVALARAIAVMYSIK